MNKKTVCGQRERYIDYLKVIAITFIVFTHDPWSVENNGLWLYSLIIDMAVPVFMIVSGYNYANSCSNRQSYTIKELYNAQILLNKAIRFLVPFIIIFLGEVLLLVVFKHKEYTVLSFIQDMLKGGYGPGAYYTPVMIQFILIVPLIYYIIHRFKGAGVIGVFILNLIYECLCTMLDLSNARYALGIFRYLFLIALGIAWCDRILDKVSKKWYGISFAIGFVYIIGTSYLYTPIIFTRWTTTSMMVGLYLFPIIMFLQKMVEKIVLLQKIEQLIVMCSNATFHIYLVQMVYYYIGIQRIFGVVAIPFRMLLSIVVCVIGGCVFYGLLSLILNKRKRESYE